MNYLLKDRIFSLCLLMIRASKYAHSMMTPMEQINVVQNTFRFVTAFFVELVRWQ
jgi:hypothetical protein